MSFSVSIEPLLSLCLKVNSGGWPLTIDYDVTAAINGIKLASKAYALFLASRCAVKEVKERNKVVALDHGGFGLVHFAIWSEPQQRKSLILPSRTRRRSSSTSTAFIYFSQGSPISPLRTVINRSPVHPKNYKIQYNLKILKRKFTHYNIAKTNIKEVKISSWPRRKPN